MIPARMGDWGRVGRDYESKGLYVVGKDTVEGLVERLASYRNLGEVLDVGCGPGYFSRPLAFEANQLVCTDISEGMLRLAAAHLADMENTRVELADCFHLPFRPESFDTVSMSNLLHVIEQPERALDEARRVLRPAGRLLVFDVSMHGMSVFQRVAAGVRYVRAFGLPPRGGQATLSPALLQGWIESAGFQVTMNEMFGSPMGCIHVCAVKPQQNAWSC
jgi:ubiquinone/menaquinone biosynthesis C-methylase UbiE